MCVCVLRVFLRIYISVLGLVVVTRDFHMKQDNARVSARLCGSITNICASPTDDGV